MPSLAPSTPRSARQRQLPPSVSAHFFFNAPLAVTASIVGALKGPAYPALLVAGIVAVVAAYWAVRIYALPHLRQRAVKAALNGFRLIQTLGIAAAIAIPFMVAPQIQGLDHNKAFIVIAFCCWGTMEAVHHFIFRIGNYSKTKTSQWGV